MGICNFCNQSAGFLRSTHPECEVRNSGSMKRIRYELASALRSTDNFDAVRPRIEAFAATGKITPLDQKRLVISEWESAVEHFLNDGELDAVEEHRLNSYIEQFNLTQAELDLNGAFTKLVMAAAIRDVIQGKLPKRIQVDGNLPVNLVKGETVVWAFQNSTYLEDKIQRTYVGRSQGLSVRVMKGVYYRVGDFKGQSVEQIVRDPVDKGTVVITNKHIYFAGPRKSLRLPYSKIVSFEPFSDGIGIMKDAANAKPQIFVTGNGWFTYNLVVNLAQLAVDD